MGEQTAGIIIIGNEILSGKVTDTNSPFMARELRKLGVSLRRVVTIADEPDLIAEEVRSFHREFDFVFTSGGVGPTHDDLTMEGVARGFGRKVVRHPDLEAGIRSMVKGEVNSAHLKMAEVPEGAELIGDEAVNFPTVCLENVYILPGIPEILEKKFVGLRERFSSSPYFLRVIYSPLHESSLAAALDTAMEEFPELLLGSYPTLKSGDHKVKLTVESKDEGYLSRAFERLLDLLPDGAVVRTE